MITIINKDAKIGEVKEILQSHGINTPFGWEIIFGMVMDKCIEFIEVHGLGTDAYFEIH